MRVKENVFYQSERSHRVVQFHRIDNQLVMELIVPAIGDGKVAGDFWEWSDKDTDWFHEIPISAIQSTIKVVS